MKLIEEFSLSKESPLYIQFFLDEIFVFTKNNSNNIYSFLEWWENRKKSASIILPEGVDAVNIMTIHASKGLEFPVVIIPACDWKYKDNELLWIDINKDNNNKLKKALAKSNLEFIDEEHIALAEDEFEKQKLDSINILYVAFTRPVHHLHVIMKPPRRKESIYHLLMEHMNTHGKLLDNETYCSFGEALPNLNSQVLEDNKEVNELMITEWRDRIRIKQGSLLSYESDSESVRDKGIVVHYVLSKVNDYLSWEQALESCKLEGIFPEIEFEEYYALLENLFSNNDVKKYFEPNQNLKIEAEILCADGKVIRPDRIVISNSEVYLIDFKTGLPQKKYSKQLSTYSDALSELGYRNIKKVLIYLNPLLVEEF